MEAMTQTMPTPASEHPVYRVFGVPFNPITREQTHEFCCQALKSDHFNLLVTLGTEMVMGAQQDTDFRTVIERADLVIPDGIGLVLASRLAGLAAPERVTGVELVADLTSKSPEGTTFFFYGAGPGVAQRAADNLAEKFGPFRLVGVKDGYVKDPEEILRAIEESRPKVLFVALGFPKQELFLNTHRERLQAAGVRLGIGVGGSFDVYSGTVERAPVIFQRLYLEWLYRVLKQPSRWKRMLVLPQFAIKVLSGPKRAVRSDS